MHICLISFLSFPYNSSLVAPPFSSPCLLSCWKLYNNPCPWVQVALLSGLDSDGQKKLNSTKDGDHHLNKMLRLLTVRTESGRDRSGIALVGGLHDPKIDGSAVQRYRSLRIAAV